MTERRLLSEVIGKKVKFVYEDGVDHTQDKVGLILDINEGLVYYHNIVRDKLEMVPISRIYRMEIMGGGQR